MVKTLKGSWNLLTTRNMALFSLVLFYTGLQQSIWAGIYSGCRTGGPGGNLWADRSAKYRYGIRHMYGLEGRRVEYKSKTCRRVMEGGGGLGGREEAC